MRFYQYGAFPWLIKESMMKTVSKNLISKSPISHSTEWYEGFVNLRMKSPSESKLGYSKEVEFLDPEVVEVTKLAEKIKWSSYFIKAYSGEASALKLNFYDPAESRMFIAKLGNRELGFIRITNHTNHFQDLYSGEVWSIAEVYVKPPYRGDGVATKLMEYVLNHHQVKSIYLETDRYAEKNHYFNKFGFTYEARKGDGLSRCYLNTFEEVISKKIALINQANLHFS